MTYDEFERRLLKLVFEEQKDTLTPSFLAYKLQMPHTEVKQHLEQSLEHGLVELHVDEDGKVNYVVPGFDPNASAAKKQARSIYEGGANYSKRSSYSAGSPLNDENAGAQDYRRRYDDDREESVEESARREVDKIAPNAPISSANLPAIVDDASELESVPPRYSIYIRKFRLYGDYTDYELSARISSVVQQLGYSPVHDTSCLIEQGNDLYKRGSFFFILILIPFFILVVPLLAYAILYAFGHSSIRSEPVYLEVGKKQLNTTDPTWEITLTFRGLHGIVFGKPDRALIDKEVQLLADELQHR